MPPPPTVTQIRLNNITTCLTVAMNTLKVLADSVKTPFLVAISSTAMSLLNNIQTLKQSKNECIHLMEQTNKLLSAIIVIHIKSDTVAELSPDVLSQIGKFTETLYKIHTFVEAQQHGNKIKNFFRQGETSTLLKECKAGLQQGLDFFQINTVNIMTDATVMQEEAEKRHQEVLNMIEALSDSTSSDGASFISRVYSCSHNSSNSISMLPSQPKIFHGREAELSEILQLFSHTTPRISILGAGGMGKTSLARAILHHTEITARYNQDRYFVACDSASTKVELASLIGEHLGLKRGKDLTHAVIKHFSGCPPTLLILDNLETLWEPAESRVDIEEFLSLLTEVKDLALVVTMRGAERPAKVQWTRPFVPPLKPLHQEAARQTFVDIADNGHSPEEVDKVLSLADNMPLAINLLAQLVDSEGCSNVLSKWQEEKTSLISQGYDQRSNLDLSISLSLSSPRLKFFPHSRELLSLLSMLPDGLSDAELVQSRLPIDNILGCKAALLRTSLAYADEHNRLKALVPIREYMQKIEPPTNALVQALHKHFQQLLEFYVEYYGTQSSSTIVARISSNLANIQNVLRNKLQQGPLDLESSIYCICHLNQFSRFTGRGFIPLTLQIPNLLPDLANHRLEVYFYAELFSSHYYYSISSPETLVSQVLKHFESLDDSEVKCRFYCSITDYYNYKHDLPTALNFCKTLISLAHSTGNTKRHSLGLSLLANIKLMLGDAFHAQAHAHEAQMLARISADLWREAQALHIESMCWCKLGGYKQGISTCNRARDLVALCGMLGSGLHNSIMISQADICEAKSEYAEAYELHTKTLQEASADHNPYNHAIALVNVAKTEVFLGAPKEHVQRKCDTARKTFNTLKRVPDILACDMVLGLLNFREGNMLPSKTIFENCIKLSLVQNPEIISPCLEKLADVSRWTISEHETSWTILFLAHSVKSKERLEIYKALQFIGDTFLAQNDEGTALNLFTVALEGFTHMDVHQSRGECMLRLGDIAKTHHDMLKSVELWKSARPLFERSLQTKQVQQIDSRLASIDKDVLEKHRNNLASLVKISEPSEDVEELEGDICDTADLNKVDFEEVK